MPVGPGNSAGKLTQRQSKIPAVRLNRAAGLLFLARGASSRFVAGVFLWFSTLTTSAAEF
ncbi:hypothetical protein [Caballeronia sp. M1242]|uniref:hypothetical protein n=1 Tax=Caballeronia sp. M1242 TaxID=2814653 RepID=UPI0019D1F136|nr:hypothetical protein [Caballeronia sp. M1242]QSN62085.1 hypothetical protein JYK05_04115 [Caballeronia sp. M1242]